MKQQEKSGKESICDDGEVGWTIHLGRSTCQHETRGKGIHYFSPSTPFVTYTGGKREQKKLENVKDKGRKKKDISYKTLNIDLFRRQIWKI